jgi:hypothetical protein
MIGLLLAFASKTALAQPEGEGAENTWSDALELRDLVDVRADADFSLEDPDGLFDADFGGQDFEPSLYEPVGPMLPDILQGITDGTQALSTYDPTQKGAVQEYKTQIGGGDLATKNGIPPQALAPVVRVFAGDGSDQTLVCTAAIVSWNDETGALMAAHCLYEGAESPAMIGSTQRERVSIEGIGTILPSVARIPAAFSVCPGLPYERCAELGGVDLAFIPFPASSTWGVCSIAPSVLDVVAFGFGLDRDELPTELLKGFLEVVPADTGLWAGRSRSTQQVDQGDSGGPVVTKAAHDLLGVFAPDVCFVIAARRDEMSLLQPVWDYTPAMTPP